MKENVFLFSRNHQVQIFENKEVAYKELGFSFIAYAAALTLGGSIEDNYNLSDKTKDRLSKLNPYTIQKIHGDFVLRNEHNEVLTIIDFQKEIINSYSPTRIRKKYSFWNGQGPVPGTGKVSHGHYFRRPETLKDIKASTSVIKEDGEPRFRGKRSKSSIITSWDDYGRSDYGDRNWKKFRKTQYKEKPQK